MKNTRPALALHPARVVLTSRGVCRRALGTLVETALVADIQRLVVDACLLATCKLVASSTGSGNPASMSTSGMRTF